MTPDNGPPSGGGLRPVIDKVRRSRWTFVLWVILVTLILVPVLFRANVSLGPGTFKVTIRPALDGVTEVGVPPVGSIRADTHQAPVHLGFDLEQVDVLEALDPKSAPGVRGIESEIRSDIGAAVSHLALVLVGVSAATGALAAIAFPGRRSPSRLASGALLGVLTTTVLVAPAAIGFNVDQFERNPQFTGPLGSAQTLLGRVGTLETRFGSVESRTQVLSAKIAELYSTATNDKIARSSGEVVMLHVSDLHLNSVGLSLARDLAENFNVDAVIDTGDITSFGFPLEAEFVETLEGFDVPYYVVAGNHDSKPVRRQLANSKAVHYLDDEEVEIGDVKVLGIGDPTVTALRTIPKEQINETYRAQFKTTERLVEADKPDLVMVHNPVQLKPILGKVPAAAAGHLHKSLLEQIDGTTVAIVGSSGATGLGNLIADQSEPYRFELLRFVDAKLVAVDEIELQGAGGDFVLQRHLIPSDGDDTRTDLPERSVEEPSLEKVERDNPGVLDSITSSTGQTSDTTTSEATSTTTRDASDPPVTSSSTTTDPP